MEAENKESQGLKMDPDANFRKPLRARKTMTPSSRKQVEILKNLHGLGRPVNSTYSMDNYVQLKMVGTECLNYSSSEETNPVLDSRQTSAKEPVAKLVVNSEISIYNGSPGGSKRLPCNGCSTDTNVKQFLNAGSLQDLLFTLYEKESESPVAKPVEVHLYPKPANQPLDQPGELTTSPASLTSGTPTSGETEKAEEMAENPFAAVLKRFQFREGNTPPDDPSRKRRKSECKEVSCKHITSSDETGEASTTQSDRSQSGLEKVRCLIQSRVDNLVGDLDHKLQQLNERIDRTQCLRKHEEITIRIIKKISRLGKHVNSIADHQRAQLSKKVTLPGAKPKITILNAPEPLPRGPNHPSEPPKRRSAEPGDVPSKTARSSATETCLNVETSGVQAKNSADSADAQQKGASSDACASVETPRAAKAELLIDLTEDEEATPEAAVSVKANPPPESTTPTPPQPTTEPSEEIPAPFPHLPLLPKIHLHPQHATGSEGSFPPQKLELAVAQVQNPKGVALQWDIREVDPRCAPIESFHLFICLEDEKKGTPSPWIKTNEIKALPLPMACSLSQFAAPGKCYFAMQSKDIFGRFGPFCDIQSISAV